MAMGALWDAFFGSSEDERVIEEGVILTIGNYQESYVKTRNEPHSWLGPAFKK